ncbi:MAG: hypothetical protein LBF34_01955 [Puniceicoccales bacterium]|nr:hypothetical protein [Puniceicoccales bacterium]
MFPRLRLKKFHSAISTGKMNTIHFFYPHPWRKSNKVKKRSQL